MLDSPLAQELLLKKIYAGMEEYRQLAIYIANRSELLPISPPYVQGRLEAIASNLEQLKQEIN